MNMNIDGIVIEGTPQEFRECLPKMYAEIVKRLKESENVKVMLNEIKLFEGTWQECTDYLEQADSKKIKHMMIKW